MWFGRWRICPPSNPTAIAATSSAPPHPPAWENVIVLGVKCARNPAVLHAPAFTKKITQADEANCGTLNNSTANVEHDMPHGRHADVQTWLQTGDLRRFQIRRSGSEGVDLVVAHGQRC